MDTIQSTYQLFLGSLLLVILIGSCKTESVDQTIPRNYFEGVADGIPFTNSSAKLFKDNEDLFTFISPAANGISLFAVVHGRETKEYPATQGDIHELALQLDSATVLDTSFTETVLLLIQTSLDALPEGESFVLLFSQNQVYYSNRGSISITQYDGSINRLFGDFDIETFNILFGPKYIQATFEDVFFTDCPDPGLCFL